MIDQGRIFANLLSAFLGNVPKSLRALVITFDEKMKSTYWTAYYDQEADEDDFEAVRVANTEFTADFTEDELDESDVEHIIYPWPKILSQEILSPKQGYLVFLRYEKNEDQ